MRIEQWTEAPQMDVGAPEPFLFSGDGCVLLCAYRARDFSRLEQDGGELGAAVVQFEGVLHYQFGYPNDEAIAAHPYFVHGIRPYSFYIIHESPAVAEFDRRNEIHNRHVKGAYIKRFKHWIGVFHDDTLEVIARSASVVVPFQRGWEQKRALEDAMRKGREG